MAKSRFFIAWLFVTLGLAKPLAEGVFHPAVATVQLHRGDQQLTPPLLDLQESVPLILAFDWLSPKTPPSLEIHFRHCTKDWEEDDIRPVEFYQGVYPIPVFQYQASVGTFKPYLHYEIPIPQAGARFLYSGNYVVEVMDRERGALLFRKRFVIVERLVEVRPSVTEARGQDARFRFQQLEFTVSFSRLPVQFLEQEVEIHLLQNWNWNWERKVGRPTVLRGNEAQYQLDPNALFPGINEFRLLDLRGMQVPTGSFRFTLTDSGYVVICPHDRVRSRSPYFAVNDLNGKFAVYSRDIGDPDYVWVILTLKSERFWDGDVYLLGTFSLWGNDERFRLIYDAESEAYVFQGWMKQGAYNYLYGVKSGNEWDITRIEGSHFETENEYTILVYYSRFGDRTHRLVGISQIQSRRN
jgi:hypothetical protein